jgi:Dolichyl-phosphate-mannose-protein mannosyltransferase
LRGRVDRGRLRAWPLAALWLALGGGLAVLTTQVADWYVMTDELLYERLALSVTQLHSPLPHVHGELIGNINQLYPLLLAPLLAGRLVPHGLHDAHVLNALVMSSACIPAALLARRVTGSTRLAYVVAVLTVCMPWIALSSFLMTESVAYPAFAWALLALHNTAVSPRPRNDLLLLVAIGVAILARTQFAVLLAIVPLALLLDRFRPRVLVAQHRVLGGAYVALFLAAIGLAAAGELSHALGTYSVTAEGNLTPSGMPRSLLEHLTPLGLGLGIAPFILAVAWPLTALVRELPRDQHAYASIAVVTVVALLFEVTSYDLRFGANRLHDRYLFYLVPLLLISCTAMVRERDWPRWAVFGAGALLAMAFAFMPVVRYDKFNVDSPVALLNEPLLGIAGSINGARALLAFVTIAVTLLLMVGRRVALAVVVVGALAIPALAGGAFTRLLAHDGTSGRPITVDQSVVFDWIDRKVGTSSSVTMLPYPFLYGSYWENVAYWWNVEFWNASVRNAAVYEDAFTGTPETFPTVPLNVDRKTGRANVSPSDYVVQGVAETRFHLSGKVLDENRGAALIRTLRPWRADWLAFDLYRDGWTIPKVTGTIRVFDTPGQTEAERRYLTISVRAPQDVPPRPFRFHSNADDWRGETNAAGTSKQISVCVPPNGYGDVHVDAPRYSPIYGDSRSEQSFVSYARSGGVLLTGIALADEVGRC